MKKISALFVFALCCITTFATHFDTDLRDGHFDEKSNEIVGTYDSPCNSGEEPFNLFIAQISMGDTTFITERILVKSYPIDFSLWMLTKNSHFIVSREFIHTTEMEFAPLAASWFNASKNKVCYAIGDKQRDDSIGIGSVFKFERIKKKWYLTGLLVIG